MIDMLVAAMMSLVLAGSLSEAEILGQADARIEKYRTGEVVLKLIGPAGESIAPGSAVRIEQTKHAFLFGCNLYMLGRCRTPEENAAYGKHFAELLNFATLPFYWWDYEAVRGEQKDDRTERMIRWCKQHDVIPKGHPLA